MRKIIIFLFIVLSVSKVFAQNLFGTKEILLKIPISNKYEDTKMYISNNGYERDVPLGPIVGKKGELIFFTNHNKIQVIENNKIYNKDVEAKLINKLPLTLNAASNNGFAVNQAMEIFILDKDNIDIITYNEFAEEKFPEKYLIFNDGIIYLGTNFNESFGIDIKNGEKQYLKSEQIKGWIDNKKNFNVVNDSIFYNKQLWGKFNDEWFSSNQIYGRLKSNHIITPWGKMICPKGFIVKDFDGNEVLRFSIEIENKKSSPNYIVPWGFGNYGEIYMLIGPALNEYSSEYSPKSGEAELVVIRNHLKYFGILNDDRIRLRKGPGTDTESLGTYPIKTGFRIIEDSGVQQTIDGVTDTWVKVRLLDGTEGYFFGQYVQNLYDGPGTPLPWPNVADWD